MVNLRTLMLCLGMSVLILDSRTAFSGALEGVELCVRTVIPSLFPFFVLSILLTSTLSGRDLPILGPLGRLFRIPQGTESLLFTGYLGGYPVGAQCVSQAFEDGKLSKTNAQRMIVLCNNCGPAFLFGMVACAFDRAWMVWAIWGTVILSSWVVSMLLPGERRACGPIAREEKITVIQALDKSLKVMARVCGWIVLFRVVLSFLERWVLWYFPQEIRVLICGIFELANGCNGLKSVASQGLRLVICAGLLSFGGLCVTVQTWSVLSSRLGRTLYFPGKALQGCAAAILAYFIQLALPEGQRCGFPWPAVVIGLIFLVFLRKKCGISRLVSV